MRKRGMLMTLAAAGMSMVVLGGLVFTARDHLLEQWFVYQLKRASAEEGWVLAGKLAGMGPPGKAAAEQWYLREFPDAEDAQKKEAASALVGLRSVKAIPELLKAYLVELRGIQGDDSNSVFWPLVVTLTRTVDSGPDQVVAMLDDSDSGVRAASCHLLAVVGPSARHTIAALTERLADPDAKTRGRAAFAVRRIGANRKAVPALTKALRDKEWTVRFYAAEALGALGPQAAPAAAALERLAREEPDDAPGQAAVEALERIGVK